MVTISTTILALTQNYWGRGETEADARAACRKAGGYGPMAFVEFPYAADPDTVKVDMLGRWQAAPREGYSVADITPLRVRPQGARKWQTYAEYMAG